MSPYLLKEVYQQIKRIVGRPIALINQTGSAFAGMNDFNRIKQFTLQESPSRDKACIAISDHPELQAIPIYSDDKLAALIVTEVVPEDVQTIQIITSLAELIAQQFLSLHKPRPDAVDLLLTRVVYRSATIDADELESQMAALGFRLDVQRTALIFELSGFWENYLQTIGTPQEGKRNLIAAKKHDIERSLSSFFSRNQDNIIGYIGNDKFLVFKDLSDADFDRFYELLSKNYDEITSPLKNIHIQKVTVGLGSPSNSAEGLLVSAQEALQVLEVGVKLRGSDHLYRSDSLGVLPLLLSNATNQKKDYAHHLLGNLEDDEELIDTLEAFLGANLNLTQAAETLKVHRNTVIYRLDKIAELLGKDPRKFTDAVELYLALQFAKIFPAES